MGAGAGVWRCNAMWEMPAARRGEAREVRGVRACVRRQAVAFLVLFSLLPAWCGVSSV
jgi:hypothetical protein